MERNWKEIEKHSAYLPWMQWQAKWYRVKNTTDVIEQSVWCCENIEGFFSIRNRGGRWNIFFFAREEDAVAFKLRWT